jgi:hypothetical protein
MAPPYGDNYLLYIENGALGRSRLEPKQGLKPSSNRGLERLIRDARKLECHSRRVS